MRRRCFLKSAAAFLPAAGLDPMVFASPPAMDAPKEGTVIGAGKDRGGESHSLGFSSILFKVLPRETNGGLFVIEHMNLTKGGPALHFHPHQEEYFYVISGARYGLHLAISGWCLARATRYWGRAGFRIHLRQWKESRAVCASHFRPQGRWSSSSGIRRCLIRVQDAAFWRRYDIELVGPSPFVG